MRPGMPDAGVADAGPMTMDGGTPRQGFEGGGCGCRVGGPASSSSPRSGGAAVLSLLAAVGLLARRRRRAA